MRGWILSLSIFVAASLSVSCSRSSNGASDNDRSHTPEYGTGVIDTVKVVKDPKAGWFGPSLRNVYMKGEDKPIVFCDSGPSFPTEEPLTIFFRQVESKPDSSACKAAVAVAKGEDAVWRDGRAVTSAELRQMREKEEHFHHTVYGHIGQRQTFAWRNPKPIGEPCPDTSGAPMEVFNRYRDQKCSVVVVYDTGLVLFVNWTVVGIDDATGSDKVGPSPEIHEITETINSRYGSKYIVTRTY